MKFPEKSRNAEELLAEMKNFQANDLKWREGKNGSFVYFAGDDVLNVVSTAYTEYFLTNGLSPLSFPSIKKMEAEVISMTANLLNGDENVVGNMTSGGTESIFMSLKTARDRARDLYPQIKEPNIVVPSSIHPAFDKACHYLNIKLIKVPVGKDLRADSELMKNSVNENTILIAASAPNYPHGVIDPIEDLASFAKEKNILFHVDACLGGFLLPFIKRLGYNVPNFDFSIEGVTSISADVHKYGYGPRGTSVILYKNSDIRKYQYFICTDWSGGLYGSPTFAGSRAGAAIAGAWAVINYLGVEGYTKKADIIMKTTRKFIDGINSIDTLEILGKPDASIFSFHSKELDIYMIGQEMSKKDWSLDNLQLPTSTSFNGYSSS
ncbi:MAG: aspartate aminotransferase family protein [Candidatus Sericytochromatia bacterium]|nr:MAG: aspartate aminotransferase family protein [Candidatus Sericytochromatia bacterium]